MKNIFVACLGLWAALQSMAQSPFPADALDLYAELKDRTVLRSAGMPPLPRSLLSEALADKNQAAALIEGELAKNHLEVVLDGEKFVRVLPANWRNSPLETQLCRIQEPKPPDPDEPTTPQVDGLPKGCINFFNVDVNEVLKIYAEIRNRTILRPVSLPYSAIRLRSQTVLTQEEAAYALTVVLALNGIAAMDDGEKFVQVVPSASAVQVQSRAPQPEKDSPLIKPWTVPSFEPFSVRALIPPQQQPSPPGAERSLRPPPRFPASTNSTVDDLVAFYATLAEREAIPEEHYGKRPILFKATTSLTKAELLYAIETTLALNGFAIARVYDKSIRAERITE